jgi:predicted phage tail protein
VKKGIGKNMPEHDLRKYKKQSNCRNLIAFFILLFVFGGGLIWWRWGTGAAIGGLLFMLIGLGLVLLIQGVLFLLDCLSKWLKEK